MFESLQDGTSVLLGTTAAVATVHALLGVDHSLPFIVLGRSRRWTLGRTMGVTMVCGVGHVASSVVIGEWVRSLGQRSIYSRGSSLPAARWRPRS